HEYSSGAVTQAGGWSEGRRAASISSASDRSREVHSTYGGARRLRPFFRDDQRLVHQRCQQIEYIFFRGWIAGAHSYAAWPRHSPRANPAPNGAGAPW